MPTTLAPEDLARLSSQSKKIEAYMLDGQWRKLKDIAARVGASETGASARIRELRLPKFGGYTVECRHVKNGLHEYRISKPKGQGRLF